MTEEIKINIENRSIDLNRGIITGKISFEIQQTYFPEKEWNDFIVVILYNWLKAIKSIVLQSSNKEELLFMDGPFFLRVNAMDRQECLLDFIEYNIQEKVLFSEKINIENLINECVHAADSCIRTCEENGYDTEDVHGLSLILKDFKNIFPLRKVSRF